jgi:ElaB/YqjD/DUF883 family membrane-anchored ribosome-binding protein
MTATSRKLRAVKAVEDTADTVSARTAEITGAMKHDLSDMGQSLSNGAVEAVASVTEKLKSVGVDTDAMTSAAKEHATELQKMVAEELRNRPMRALGVAAAIGVVVGLMTAR